MKRSLTIFALATIAAINRTPAYAVPPVATPSPGYDARLQESRKATTTPVTPAPQPKKKPRKGQSQ